MKFIFILLATIACSSQPQHEDKRSTPPTNQDLSKIQGEIEALQGTQSQIDAFVNGEYDNCTNVGDGAAAFVQQVCKIAQSASASAMVQLKGEFGTYDNALKQQIQAVSDNLTTLTSQETSDINSINTQIASINTQITTINASITTLQSQMTSAQSAITALQTLTSSISNTLNNTLTTVEIGTENVSAGPLYESVERRTDKTKIVGYVEAFSTTQVLPNNALTATNGSGSIKVTLTNHGFSVGDTLQLTGLTGAKGFTNQDVTGYITVATVVDANDFTFNVTHLATSNGPFGGSNGSIGRVSGRGLAQVWQTSSGADTAVRTTSYGTPYNWIVKADGTICYDKTVANQTFANINAGGANVVCK